MIRQAHTYLVSAMSGATLIAIAIAAFVMLVSAQVFRDWPLAALGDGGGAAVSRAHPLTDGGTGGESAAVAIGAPAAAPKAAGSGGATRSAPGGGNGYGSAGAGIDSIGDAGSGPAAGGGGAGAAPVSNGGGGGADQPTAPAQSPSASDGSGSASSSGGGSGGPSNPPSATTGGGSGGGSTAGTTESTSAAVTETVNGTVGKVDETVLGGTLEDAGVTGATEGVVEGVAGPESAVGHIVDETAKTVGGLLGGNR